MNGRGVDLVHDLGATGAEAMERHGPENDGRDQDGAERCHADADDPAEWPAAGGVLGGGKAGYRQLRSLWSLWSPRSRSG